LPEISTVTSLIAPVNSNGGPKSTLTGEPELRPMKIQLPMPSASGTVYGNFISPTSFLLM
jgi:hypothetical protein